MNSTRRVPLALAAVTVAVLVAALPVAAQSKASTKSVDSMNAVIKEVTKARDQIQGALDALNALGASESANLTKNYNTFTKNVDAVTKTSATIKARAESMKANREAYLAEWQKKLGDIKDPAIQEHVKVRAEQMKATFETMQPAAQTARESFPPFLSNLQDIQKLLSIDLSSSGVTAAKPIFEQAKGNGTTVVKGLDDLLAQMTKIRDTISPKKA